MEVEINIEIDIVEITTRQTIPSSLDDPVCGVLPLFVFDVLKNPELETSVRRGVGDIRCS